MSRRRITTVCILSVIAMTFTTAIQPAFAQTPQPEYPAWSQQSIGYPPYSNAEQYLLKPGQDLVHTADGRTEIIMQKDAAEIASVPSLQTTGGPDDYGYTWNDSVSFNWIDARTGVDTGLSSVSTDIPTVSEAIDLGFSFNFYGTAYQQIYISTSGTVGFNSDSLRQSAYFSIPNSNAPNNFIAPYMARLRANSGSYAGKIYYSIGGTAPNRYFVTEWYQVQDVIGNSYTFEAILFENGNIEFSYQSMIQDHSYSCNTGAGIENDTGEDGIAYTTDPYSCAVMSDKTGKTVLFIHPVPQARVGIDQLYYGSLTNAEKDNRFNIHIRNIGDPGSDTYQLISTSSTVTMQFFAENGTTPLTDTDGDSIPDTGTIAQGGETIIQVAIQTPSDAVIGDNYSAILTVRSSVNPAVQKNLNLQLSIPAPFVQIYEEENAGGQSLYAIRPDHQVKLNISGNSEWASSDGVIELSNQNIFVLKNRLSRNGNYETSSLKFSIISPYGAILRDSSTLFQMTDTTDIWGGINGSYAVTAPNGQIGVVWVTYQYNNADLTLKYDLNFALLNTNGDLVYGPTNLINSAWMPWNNSSDFTPPQITATSDNRFIITWVKRYYANNNSSDYSNYISDVYYTVRNSTGGVVKDITKLTNDYAGSKESFSYPVTTSTLGNQVLIVFMSNENGLKYAVVKSDGSVSAQPKILSVGLITPHQLHRLPNGKFLVLGYGQNDNDRVVIQYLILNSSYQVNQQPTSLDLGVTGKNANYASAVTDANGHVAITWLDISYKYLYYALVDQNGILLSPPQVILSATPGEYGKGIQTAANGQSATNYTWQPSNTQDTWVDAQEGLGYRNYACKFIPITIGNKGGIDASSVMLTATLSTGLTYQGTNGVNPPYSEIVNEGTIRWNVGTLATLEKQSFFVDICYDPAVSDPHQTLDLTISEDGTDGDTADNTATINIFAEKDTFIPLIYR